ncbi:MAG: MFS transporter [Acidimicrobiia bacterium]
MLPLFAGLTLLMVGSGLLGPLVGVRADLDGFPTIVIGAVMSMFYVGFLLGSLTIPRWLVSVGHIRVFAGLTALAGATALSYSLLVTPVVWGGLQFVFGLCMSGLFVTVESWLNERASNETRGRLLSVYMLVVTFGLGIGQVLLGVASPADSTLFILVGIAISLAVVPVALIRIPTPREVIPVKLSLGGLWRTAPLGVLAVAVAGAAGSSVLGLGAVYATRIGMDPALIGVFVTTSMVGGALTQYPLGQLSDRLPRRRVILVMAAFSIVVAVAGAVVVPGSPLQYLVVAAYGGLAFPMYSVAVSQINDSIPADQLVAVAAGIMFFFGIGSVIGPFGVSVLMELRGPVGYFWGLAIYFAPLVVYAFVRIVSKTRPKQREFISLPPRSSTAAALLVESSDDD